MDKFFHIEEGKEVAFYNNATYCVGTGRMGLALHKEYQEQLKLVQEEIGFSHIRGHGLFCDDMAIYQEHKDAQGNVVSEYNFTYLDRVVDDYLSLNIRPFLELGFMPEKLASGDQTVFYWKGNVTPPVSYEKWAALVQETLRHLIKRYGEEEVTSWPIEVWNEPNLKGFWKDADMKEYFKLYEYTANAIKAVNGNFKVGGPAICGVNDEVWMAEFLEFVKSSQAPLDFVTRHHYTINPPEREGHYQYVKLADPDAGLKELNTTRRIVDSFPEFAGMQIHITEFNTAYIPDSPLHDTNRNAAYIAYLLSKLGEDNESYSYWTFGDVFEEQGVPYTPFHGGFGLVANGLVPKPTFWTFKFFKELQGKCVCRERELVLVKKQDKYCGVAWNLNYENTGEPLNITCKLPADNKEYCLVQKIVDESCCNPLKIWHDLGEPANPDAAQLGLIKESARPLVKTQRLKGSDGNVAVALELQQNAVVYFELFEAPIYSDRGYDYSRVMNSLDIAVEKNGLKGV